MVKSTEWCNYYWGGHGCNLRPGGHHVHYCGTTLDSLKGACSEYDEDRLVARYMEWDGDIQLGWSEWTPNYHGFRTGPLVPK